MPNELKEFMHLPNDVQTEIASYLDVPSLCFFAMTSKRSLQNALPVLKQQKKTLLRSPICNIKVLHNTMFYTQNALYVCGRNVYGELGLGHNEACYTFTKVENLPGKIQLVTATLHRTLVLTDEGLFACGYNDDGKLGVGHNKNCFTFTQVEDLPDTILHVVATYYFGDNRFVFTNEGLYAISAEDFIFTKIADLPGTVQQVVFNSFCILILTEKGLYEVNIEPIIFSPCAATFKHIDLPGVVEQIAFGMDHVLVLTDQGLYAYGKNEYGQLGLGHTNLCPVFTKVENLPGTIQQVTAGHNHSIVLTSQGLYSCGNNNDGQLGLGAVNKIYTTFTKVNEFGQVSLKPLSFTKKGLMDEIWQVLAGDGHTLAWTNRGLYLSGRHRRDSNSSLCRIGYEGIFNKIEQDMPGGEIQQVVTGYGSSLVLTDEGLYACGGNEFGQLGLGHNNCCWDFTKIELPVEIKRLLSLYRQIDTLAKFSPSSTDNTSISVKI